MRHRCPVVNVRVAPRATWQRWRVVERTSERRWPSKRVTEKDIAALAAAPSPRAGKVEMVLRRTYSGINQ
jgi:hypothetical protein